MVNISLRHPRDDDLILRATQVDQFIPTWVARLESDGPFWVSYTIYAEYSHPPRYSPDDILDSVSIHYTSGGNYEALLRTTTAVTPPDLNRLIGFSIQVVVDDGNDSQQLYGPVLGVDDIAPYPTERSYETAVQKTYRASARALLNTASRTGYRAKLYQRKVRGPRCSRCWDEVTETPRFSNCSQCLGTTYEGGYYRVPLLLGLYITSYTEETRKTPVSIARNVILRGIIPYYHGIKDGDVLVVPSLNKGFNIRAVQLDPHQRTLQILAESLNPGDVRATIVGWSP